MMTLARVDFPDPFGPMMAWTSPCGTTRSMPFRIALPSTSTRRSRTSSVAVPVRSNVSAVCATSVLQFDQQPVALHLHWKGHDGQGRRKRPRLPGLQVENGSDPGAFDSYVVHVDLDTD